MSSKFPAFGLFLTLIFATSSLPAHDMWLIPKSATLKVNQPCEIYVAVGMDFPNSVSAISPERLTWKVTNGEDSIENVEARRYESALETVGQFKPGKPGLWMVGCNTRPNQIELEAKKFNSYLLHDGMPHVLDLRLERDELGKDAHEQYSKYTKTMVAVGDDLTEQQYALCQRPLGHKLEIVPLENLHSKQPGNTLNVQVLFNGQPLKNANLCWDHPDNGEKFTGQASTNDEGQVVVPISQAGLMTLRLVHMTRPEGQEFEWESFWSSFTFTIGSEE